MFNHVMRYCMYVHTYVMAQYDFFDNRKAMMVLLPIGLC